MHTQNNEQINDMDEIVSIEYIGLEDTIDINVSGDKLFYAKNGSEKQLMENTFLKEIAKNL